MKKTNLNCFLPSFQDNSGHENSYLEVYEKLSKIKSFNIELFVAKNNTIKTTLKKNSIFFKNRNFFFLKIFNIFRNLKVINKISKLSKKETVFLLDGHSFYFLLAFILSLTNANKFKKLILFCRYNYKGIQKMIFKFFVFFLKKKFSESILIVDNNFNYKIFKKNFKYNTIKYFPTPFFTKEKNKKIIEKIEKTVLCPGQYRYEKFGKNLFDFLEKNKDSQIKISISKKFKYLISGKIKFNKFEENLDKKKYIELIKKNSIIILPYDASLYKYRTSGIFFESINFNKIIFVTNNTWFSSELKRFKLYELIINDWSKFNLDKKLSELHITKIEKKLNLMRKEYFKFHNQNNFVKILKNTCEQ